MRWTVCGEGIDESTTEFTRIPGPTRGDEVVIRDAEAVFVGRRLGARLEFRSVADRSADLVLHVLGIGSEATA